jgi:methylmalonyl-CoA mutase C-terminal domain/subunit
MGALKDKGATDVVVFGGGIIPDDDLAKLKEAGVKGIFTPGTRLEEIIAWVKENVRPRA